MGRRAPIALVASVMIVLGALSYFGIRWYLGEPRPLQGSIHDKLLAEAKGNYTYGRERPPIDESNGQGPRIPRLRIRGAERRDETGRPRSHRFLGRMHSTGRYAPLGLQGWGNYYLWTDYVASWGRDTGQVRVLVVPASGRRKMFWLKIDSVHARMRMQTSAMIIPAAWSGAQATQPLGPTEPVLRLTPTTLLACSDGCSSGHCASTDVLRVYDPVLDDPTMEIP